MLNANLLNLLQLTDPTLLIGGFAHSSGLETLKRILKLDDECTAVKLALEMREASKKLGMRLIKVFQPLCKSKIVDAYKDAIIEQQAMGHYALVFGMYACALKISKAEALTGFYYNAAVCMVTNSVKLVPLGQQDG